MKEDWLKEVALEVKDLVRFSRSVFTRFISASNCATLFLNSLMTPCVEFSLETIF